ncbi:unnamed protein product [Cuscuta epithymum]|uniref:C-CAP/cofactor C-like domain-containing protein n=1 Tax=Cuscuta epithymum TaxID=186058 RepID=A0AAV0CFR5_9ASTE|nr:unnamed protein product [Cuscuta epithymum]
MEEDEPLGTACSTLAGDHSDVAIQRKHVAMLEHLSNLHQSRLARKPNSDSYSSSGSTQSFLSHFSESKQSIESELSRICKTQDPQNVKPELEKVSISIANLEKEVAESSYFLPSYDVRSCLKTISDLKQTLEQVSSSVLPKKKFSFRNKTTNRCAAASNGLIPEAPSENNTIENVIGPTLGFMALDSPGFQDKENEVLTMDFRRTEAEKIGEFMLSDLRGCEVRLLGCVRALFVHKLANCRVYVGPVTASVLIEEVKNCIFVLASHQIRIHHATDCDFYLRVRSRPIIEDCTGVRVAPYCFMYDGIERDLEKANLGEESGNWANVDDFRWLRAAHSPNWSVLPEKDRIEEVTEISKPEY